MIDDIFSPLDTIQERNRDCSGGKRRWRMTRTAAGDEENGGRQQMAMVDDVRRR